jgi:cytochrome c oxidase subunit 3
MIQTIEGKQTVNEQRKKIHPHKFTLWVALGSIIMMFAGLTWYSTVVILVSSLTIQMALKAFRDREMLRYRNLLTTTAILGILFVVLQWTGFRQIWHTGITLRGSGGGQFLYIIAGLHGLHVLGGIIALVVMFGKAFASRVRNYNAVPVELMSTYWHFVDLLWIYLFIFFMAIK